MDVQKLKRKARELHSEYGFSRVELAKIMFIVSTTLIVVSIPAALSFQSAANQAESVNNQLSQTSAILNSDRVQTSLDVLRNAQGSSFDQISAAIDAFEQSEQAVNNTQNLQTDMERNMEMYQWLVLIGIIGEVAAAAIFFS
jgi:competence protein ComGC